MAKKLKANIFVYSANDLISGDVVFYSEQNGWVRDFISAKRIMKEELEKFQEKVSTELKQNNIINPYLVELDDDGKITKLRERIRFKGINIKDFKNV
tara:strand:- start:735 stop:1025 length:291 start_codon:yes stop_codon:yes gene_type:complete